MDNKSLAQVWRNAALAVLLGGVLGTALAPALAFHFPWDQGHDTTNSNDPPPPGPDDRPQCDPDCNGKARGSPAYAATGHAYWNETDVVLRGRPYLGVYRAYNSNDPTVGIFGNGWSVDFDVRMFGAVNGRTGSLDRIVSYASGKRVAYQSDFAGNFFRSSGRREYVEVVVRNGESRALLVWPDGGRWIFDRHGFLVERIDANGNRVLSTFDASGRPVSRSDGNGRSLVVAYNSNGLVETIADHTGRVWRYGYDTNGNLVSVADPLGGVRRYAWQAYRPSGDAHTYFQLLSVTDAAGVVLVRYSYAAEKVATYTEGANTITYTRQASNTRVQGSVTRRDSVGATTRFSYGELGLITSEVDGIGGTTSYVYDNLGMVTATTDSLGRVWPRSYDSLGRMTSASNPLGQTSSIQYSGSDPRPVRMTSPSGRVVTMSYDARGNLLTTTDPIGAVTRMAYNAQGDVTGITNALNQSTAIVYNTRGLPTQVTDPLGRTSTMGYDALGRVSAATNAAGETTRYAYDVLDRVTTVTDPLNQVTAFTYDAAGRLTSVTDAKGSITRYEYDGNGRRSAEVAPDGRRTTYSYRADNLLSTITWPDNTAINYQYDNNKRVTRETAGSEVINYGYNAVNQLTSATGPGGTVSYTYDNAGRVATETSGGRTNTIVRNAEGERIRLDYLAQSQTYTRDVRGLVTRIASPAGNFDFSFDALGRRTRLAYPNGSTASYAFDAAGQLTNLTHAGVFNAPYAHTFDAAGRITRITGDGPDWNYTYDALGRLTRATQAAETYTYTLDPVGNILDGGRSHDVNHRLVADASKDYSFDARGNLTLERDRTTGARTVYAWNVKNQLSQVQFFSDATPGSLNRTLAYTYDPIGRRASKVDNGTTQRFVYDGKKVIGTLDAGTVLLTHAVFGPSADEPLAIVGGGLNRSLYANQLGSIVGVAASSSLSHRYYYGPYGDEMSGSSSGDGSPYRFAGSERDSNDFQYHRARYYGLKQKQFLSSDPIGVYGGSNRYRYANANPVSLSDPDGLYAGVLVGAGIRILGGRAAAAAVGSIARRALGPVAGGIAACVLAGVCSLSEPETPDAPADGPPIPDKPDQCPGEGWEWRGKQPVGGDKGAWHNPETGESLHPDLDHPAPIGPHWDYTDRNGKGWRIFPDGRREPK
jgi:RHS repeat-associated protein